jgi:dolichol-phosphate mannosyltransferase
VRPAHPLADTASPPDPSVYFVLPAYNEAGSLPPLLARIEAVMTQQSLRYEVILVNDGSKDDTLRIAEHHRLRMPLTIIDHGRNRGLGEAMKSGFLKAGALAGPADVIVMMDADNTHPPELLPLMLRRIAEGYELVVASRFVEGARQVGLRWHRRMLSLGAGTLLRIVFPVAGVRDYSCGYRAYSGSIIRRALDTYGDAFIEEQGFSCFVDLLLKLRRLGVRACEVPLVLRYDLKQGASKMRISRTVLRYLRLIARNLASREGQPFRQLVRPAVVDGPRPLLDPVR